MLSEGTGHVLGRHLQEHMQGKHECKGGTRMRYLQGELGKDLYGDLEISEVAVWGS